MSLLPGTILFPSMPFARVELDEQGRVKDEGLCVIEMNWWLFLYNLSQQVLGTPGGGTTTGLPASALIEIASIEADADDADAIAARNASAALALIAQEAIVPADGSDVSKLKSDAASAMLLALDGLLPDSGAPAAPTAKVGLTAVPGSAWTFLRSDGAPPIDQTIAPTWTGTHTFAPAAGTLATRITGSGGKALSIDKLGSTINRLQAYIGDGTTGVVDDAYISGNNTTVHLGTVASPDILKINVGGTVAASGALGVNAVTPPAQVTGWGTPTGTGVIANFPGATATLAQCGQAIAQIIKDLKAFGLYAA